MGIDSNPSQRWGLALSMSVLLVVSVRGSRCWSRARRQLARDFARQRSIGSHADRISPAPSARTAEVPLDYDSPTGATTQIALARIPASDRRPIVSAVCSSTLAARAVPGFSS